MVVDVDPSSVARTPADRRTPSRARPGSRRPRHGHDDPRRHAARAVRPCRADDHAVQRRARADAASRSSSGSRTTCGRTASARSSSASPAGIDSALVAALAVEALGPERVHCVSMPSRFSSEGTRGDAQQLAESARLRLPRDPDRADGRGATSTRWRESFEGREPDLTEENLQARIRGTLLMALSNKFGWLLVATGNKSEMSVGYATLYGDMAGGFALLKDVFKTDVFRLSIHLNERAGRELIPQSIIERAPSAELRADQRDEDSLPPYPQLDRVLEGYVEEDRSIDELSSDGIDPDVVKRAVAMIDRAEYKRRQAPPGVRLRPKAFGRDRRTPITNRWSELDAHSRVLDCSPRADNSAPARDDEPGVDGSAGGPCSSSRERARATARAGHHASSSSSVNQRPRARPQRRAARRERARDVERVDAHEIVALAGRRSGADRRASARASRAAGRARTSCNPTSSASSRRSASSSLSPASTPPPGVAHQLPILRRSARAARDPRRRARARGRRPLGHPLDARRELEEPLGALEPRDGGVRRRGRRQDEEACLAERTFLDA